VAAMTADLSKNGTTTTTTTMNLASSNPPTSAAVDQPASAAPTRQPLPSSNDLAQNNKILYGLDDCPSWYLCVFLGLQVTLFSRLCQRFKSLAVTEMAAQCCSVEFFV